ARTRRRSGPWPFRGWIPAAEVRRYAAAATGASSVARSRGRRRSRSPTTAAITPRIPPNSGMPCLTSFSCCTFFFASLVNFDTVASSYWTWTSASSSTVVPEASAAHWWMCFSPCRTWPVVGSTHTVVSAWYICCSVVRPLPSTPTSEFGRSSVPMLMSDDEPKNTSALTPRRSWVRTYLTAKDVFALGSHSWYVVFWVPKGNFRVTPVIFGFSPQQFAAIPVCRSIA